MKIMRKCLILFTLILSSCNQEPSDTGKDRELPEAPARTTAAFDEQISPEKLEAEPAGLTVAQARTDKIIAKLKKESFEDTINNLDNVNEFYYPGFYAETFMKQPFDAIHTILSNRRFIKLYNELRSQSHDEQYIYLNKALKDYLSQYHDLLSPYHNKPDLSRSDYLELCRISDTSEKAPTLSGTRHAIRTIALLCGALGNVQMWPELRDVFQNPITGRNMSLDEYNAVVSRNLKNHPVFPMGIQTQVIWLLSRYSEEDEVAQYGFDISRVKSVVSDDMLRTLKVPNYQSKITMYDLSYRAKRAVDLSYGSHSFDFLVTDNVNVLENLLDEYNTTVR